MDMNIHHGFLAPTSFDTNPSANTSHYVWLVVALCVSRHSWEPCRLRCIPIARFRAESATSYKIVQSTRFLICPGNSGEGRLHTEKRMKTHDNQVRTYILDPPKSGACKRSTMFTNITCLHVIPPVYTNYSQPSLLCMCLDMVYANKYRMKMQCTRLC